VGEHRATVKKGRMDFRPSYACRFYAMIAWILLVCLLQFVDSFSVAIVGSGVGGASAAYNLRKSHPDAQITVFEQGPDVGGRARTIRFTDGNSSVFVDAGATSIYSANSYLNEIVDTFHLSKKPDSGDKNDVLGIWDGDSFVFHSKESGMALPLNIIAHYGFSPRHIISAVKTAVNNLGNIYSLQSNNVSFSHPRDMFEALNLYNLTQTSAYDYFKALHVSDKFMHEFIDGASRDNYNQPGTVNAFVDLVSLAGAGIDGHVYELANGTTSIAREMLAHSAAKVQLNSAVKGIATQGEGYTVTVSTDKDVSQQHFDAAIIATPLEFSHIELPTDVPDLHSREYQEVYVTFVAGELSKSYFGRSDLDTVLTTENPTSPFTCIGRHSTLQDGGNIWKLFSQQPLRDAALDTVFESRTAIERYAWNSTGAYPKLQPQANWPPFELRPGLVYVNAMESAVSCMETQVISGRNAALLVGKLAGVNDKQ